MFKKITSFYRNLSRLDKLEIVLFVFSVFLFIEIFKRYGQELIKTILLSICIISFVWIEIHRSTNKK
ncbi:hypothetical protein C8N46_102388 [Kordia periserrulae]|uniref:Uncharacterized protein n=1 Tax=Kordia periserrulae TaxID=701523 RepID=A0A2T6C3Y6_9FLAO|nr:hypothetical protein C8N46_102388 [Kordia periserrulae]